MGGLSTGFGTNQKNEPPSVFPVGAAQNGLSVDGTGKIVLGQDEGQAGDPAALTSNREIPLQFRLVKFLDADGVVSIGDINLHIEDTAGDNIADVFHNIIQVQDVPNGLTASMSASRLFLNDVPGGRNMEALANSVTVTDANNLNFGRLAFDGLSISDPNNSLIANLDSTQMFISNNVTGDGITITSQDIQLFSAGPVLFTINNDGTLFRIIGPTGDNFEINAATGMVNANLGLTIGANGIDITGGVTINGNPGFTGTVSPVTSITVENGIVTACS